MKFYLSSDTTDLCEEKNKRRKKGAIRIYQISCVILKNKSKGSFNYLPARKHKNMHAVHK